MTCSSLSAGLAVALLGASCSIEPVRAAIRITASINDLASIAASVGGEHVATSAIGRPDSDVHRIEVLPSYMVRVGRADLYLKVGLGLDPWADAVIDGSRNARVRVIDCSEGISVLEKPTGPVSATMGHLHPGGNPHYWTDPRNGAVVARTVARELAALDPAHADRYHERAEAFAADCAAMRDSARGSADDLPVFTYHRSWSYFADAFQLAVVGTIEPVPGIPPTGKHLAELLQLARSERVHALIQEPYFSREAGEFLERECGVRIVVASASCAEPTAGSYLAHLQDVLARVRAVTGGQP